MNFETWWKEITAYRKVETLSSETWLKKFAAQAYAVGFDEGYADVHSFEDTEDCGTGLGF
jgi:hypothetical protein